VVLILFFLILLGNNDNMWCIYYLVYFFFFGLFAMCVLFFDILVLTSRLRADLHLPVYWLELFAENLGSWIFHQPTFLCICSLRLLRRFYRIDRIIRYIAVHACRDRFLNFESLGLTLIRYRLLDCVFFIFIFFFFFFSMPDFVPVSVLSRAQQ